MLHCTALYCAVLHCTVLLYCTVLYCTVLYCTVLYCTVLYCTVTVLYCTVLYCTVLIYFKNYLQNRRQQVTLEGTYSDELHSGPFSVIQGSVLSCLLFLIYTLDIPMLFLNTRLSIEKLHNQQRTPNPLPLWMMSQYPSTWTHKPTIRTTSMTKCTNWRITCPQTSSC